MLPALGYAIGSRRERLSHCLDMLRKPCGMKPFTEAGIAQLPTAYPTGIDQRLKYRTYSSPTEVQVHVLRGTVLYPKPRKEFYTDK